MFSSLKENFKEFIKSKQSLKMKGDLIRNTGLLGT
jgi:hypothetical protein